MSKQEDKSPINPFEAAVMQDSVDVTVRWTLEDMQELRPDWPRHRCEWFLRRHANDFATGMLRIGLNLLKAISADPMLGGDSDGQESEKS